MGILSGEWEVARGCGEARALEEILIKDGAVTLDFCAFEVKTIMLV